MCAVRVRGDTVEEESCQMLMTGSSEEIRITFDFSEICEMKADWSVPRSRRRREQMQTTHPV